MTEFLNIFSLVNTLISFQGFNCLIFASHRLSLDSESDCSDGPQRPSRDPPPQPQKHSSTNNKVNWYSRLCVSFLTVIQLVCLFIQSCQTFSLQHTLTAHTFAPLKLDCRLSDDGWLALVLGLRCAQCWNEVATHSFWSNNCGMLLNWVLPVRSLGFGAPFGFSSAPGTGPLLLEKHCHRSLSWFNHSLNLFFSPFV